MRLAILAKPGMCAGDIMRACPDVQSADGYCVFLKNLTEKGVVSRARVGKKLHYWPPGQAPANTAAPEVLPADEENSKTGIDRAEAATSDDRSAGVGHATEAALRPTSGSKQRGPQHASPIPRGPAEAMKAGGRSAAGPSPGNIQSGRPSLIITPDWCIYPHDDCVLVIHKDTQTGFRLDVEAVAAIAGLVGAA